VPAGETNGTSMAWLRSLPQLAKRERTMSNESYVAVGLLTRRDLDVLGSGFRRAYPLDEHTDFTALLELLDNVDRDRREAPRLQ